MPVAMVVDKYIDDNVITTNQSREISIDGSANDLSDDDIYEKAETDNASIAVVPVVLIPPIDSDLDLNESDQWDSDISSIGPSQGNEVKNNNRTEGSPQPALESDISESDVSNIQSLQSDMIVPTSPLISSDQDDDSISTVGSAVSSLDALKESGLVSLSIASIRSNVDSNDVDGDLAEAFYLNNVQVDAVAHGNADVEKGLSVLSDAGDADSDVELDDTEIPQEPEPPLSYFAASTTELEMDVSEEGFL
jgi:hypothetical protein